MDVLGEAIADYRLETGGAENPVESFVEWLAEWGRALRRRQNGLLLLTAHRAKGLEFDHVVILDGDWRRTSGDEDPDAWRRLYYVAMTRARKTLTLTRTGAFAQSRDRKGLEVHDGAIRGASIPELRDNPSVLQRPSVAFPQAPPELDLRRQSLQLRDIDLGFAGRRTPGHPIHGAIRQLVPGDQLSVRTDRTPWEITTQTGLSIGRLARQYTPQGQFHAAQVKAVVRWCLRESEPEYQDRLRCDEWEVVVPEFVFA